MKLYVAELDSARVRRAVARSDRTATSRVAYPEARAALARRRREGGLSAAGLRRAVADLDRDLPHVMIVELDERIARRAGDVAERLGLRGFDAIHLASALELRDLTRADVAFLAFDARLAAAASVEGLPPPAIG